MANPNNVNGNNTGQQIAAQFGFPSNDRVLPNSTDPDTGNSSLGSAGDFMSGTFADPNGIVGGLYNDIMGLTSQQREFAQQEYMTDKQNRFNSEQERMKRAKEAGINPLTAAGGIAGSGSSGVAAAGGSASPTGIGDLANAASSIAGLPSEIAQRGAAAEQSLAVARNADRLADAQILKDAASSASLLTAAGVPEIAAMELGLSLARNGLQGFSAAFNADNYCRKFDLEMDEIDALINSENQRFESLQQQSNLYRSEAQLANERAMHENILKQYDQKKLEIAKQYEAMFADSDTLQQFILAQKFGVDSPEYKAYMGFLQDKFYNQSKGQFDADIDTAFSRFYNQAKAKADVDAAFAPYLKKIDVLGNALEEFTRAMLENPSSIDGALTTFINKIFNAAYGTQINFDPVNSASPPIPGNADVSKRGG